MKVKDSSTIEINSVIYITPSHDPAKKTWLKTISMVALLIPSLFIGGLVKSYLFIYQDCKHRFGYSTKDQKQFYLKKLLPIFDYIYSDNGQLPDFCSQGNNQSFYFGQDGKSLYD